MSVLEDVRDLEGRVVSRLAELRPLVEEYEQLRQVADRLGLDVGSTDVDPAAARRRGRRSGATTAAPTKPASKTRRRRSSSRRASGGTKAVGEQRRARILELIEQRPGITVSEISRELGVEPPPLYRTVRKLQAEQLVRKDGTSLTLA